LREPERTHERRSDGPRRVGAPRGRLVEADQPPSARRRQHVHASEPLFIIGATLAHVGRLKACFKAIHADTPEEARAIRAALEKIKLPAQYQYPPRAKRR
jgi:hypothetical protein